MSCKARGRAGDLITGPRVTLTQDVVISLQIAGARRNWINFQANLQLNEVLPPIKDLMTKQTQAWGGDEDLA